MSHDDTIVAIATAPGRAALGILRISGPRTHEISRALLGELPQPRQAVLRRFLDEAGEAIDQGLAIYFPAPHSFTGEHCLELYAHGGPIVLDLLLSRIGQLGARPANPGEFSQRAFLNDKLDLAQAEAVADLIDSHSVQAAKAALRSLEGEFSRRIVELRVALVAARAYVEAALDFPDEDIDFLSDTQLLTQLDDIQRAIEQILNEAGQGAVLREGATVVIAGAPNVGKSSLINYFTGRDTAIVTDIPGTTRDALRETIDIDGLPLKIIDTAGLRESSDVVEREGVRRSRMEIEKADLVLVISDTPTLVAPEPFEIPTTAKRILVRNKIDLSGDAPGEREGVIHVSVTNGLGLDALRTAIKTTLRYEAAEGAFLARRRHVIALEKCRDATQRARAELNATGAGELAAEEMRIAHQALGQILGAETADDLLGHIFSEFCIGK